jgi:hypothetical protein
MKGDKRMGVSPSGVAKEEEDVEGLSLLVTDPVAPAECAGIGVGFFCS